MLAGNGEGSELRGLSGFLDALWENSDSKEGRGRESRRGHLELAEHGVTALL